MIYIILVTPKAAAKHELLFNKPTSSLALDLSKQLKRFEKN